MFCKVHHQNKKKNGYEIKEKHMTINKFRNVANYVSLFLGEGQPWPEIQASTN